MNIIFGFLFLERSDNVEVDFQDHIQTGTLVIKGVIVIIVYVYKPVSSAIHVPYLQLTLRSFLFIINIKLKLVIACVQ